MNDPYAALVEAEVAAGDPYQNAIDAELAENAPVDPYEVAVESAMPVGGDPYENMIAQELGASGMDMPTAGPTVGQLLKGGFEMGKGQFQYGLGTTLGMFGNDTGKEKMLEWSQMNMNDAQVNPEGLMDDVIFTAGQVGLPIATTAAAALAAPFVGLTAAVGAGIAGFATAWGMNAGDFYSKEQAEDPTFEPGFVDLGITGLLAVPEMLPISKGIKVLKPLGEAVGTTVAGTAMKNGVRIASDAPSYVKGIAGQVAEQSAIEGIQDFTGSVTAALRTGSELDANKIASFADAAAYEALIGGILGAPLGAVSTMADKAVLKQEELDAKYEAQTPVLIQNEDGTLSSDFTGLQMVEGATKQPGFFSLALAPLMGNATDPLKLKLRDNPKAQALLQQFAMNRNERGPGKVTINEKAKAFEGEILAAAQVFNKATEAERKAAWEAKGQGIEPRNAVEQALWDTLNTKIPDIMRKASRNDDLTGTLFESKDYLPIYNALDWNKLTADTASVLKSAEQDMIANGKTEAEIAATLNILKTQQESYLKQGNPLTYAREGKVNKVREKLYAGIEKQRAKGPLTSKARAVAKKKLMSKPDKSTKEGVLTLDRSLKNLSQEWLNKHGNGKDPKTAFNQHVRMVTEQAALIDTFGVDNRLFDEAMIDIALDAAEKGKPLDAAQIEKFYDILRTQQRIHLKPLVNQRVRDAQNMTKAVLNMQMLGLSALVSIPESLGIFMNNGGKAALKGLVQTAMRGMGSKEAGIAAENLGYTLAMATDHSVNRIENQTDAALSKNARKVDDWQQAFMRWTGLPYLQHFLTVWAARSADVHVKSLLTELTEGSPSLQRSNYINRKLAEAGVDSDAATTWAANGFKESDPYFQNTYIPAIVGLTNDTIVDPQPIDKPLWMNDERFLLISQLKGFMTVFTNRFMRTWKNKMDGSPEGNRVLATKIAPYLAMYLAGQVAMGAVRASLKGGEDALDEWYEKGMGEHIWSAAGYVGALSYFVDTINSLRWRSDPLASAAGPLASKTLGLAGEAVSVIEGTDPEDALKKIAKQLTPNMPFKDIMLEAFGVIE